MLSYLSLSKRSLKNGDLAQALQHCEAFLANDPNDVSGLRLKADILTQQGHLGAAISALDEVIKLAEGFEEPHDYLLRGMLRLQHGDAARAVADCTRVVNIERRRHAAYYSEQALLLRALAYALYQRWQKAMDDLAKVGPECTVAINDAIITRRTLVECVDKREHTALEPATR